MAAVFEAVAGPAAAAQRMRPLPLPLPASAAAAAEAPPPAVGRTAVMPNSGSTAGAASVGPAGSGADEKRSEAKSEEKEDDDNHVLETLVSLAEESDDEADAKVPAAVRADVRAKDPSHSFIPAEGCITPHTPHAAFFRFASAPGARHMSRMCHGRALLRPT
jgi:hypothetical protein